MLRLWWLLLLAGIVIIISPVRVWLDYRHRGKVADSLLIQVGVLWNAWVYSTEVPVISAGKSGSLQTSPRRPSQLPRPSRKRIAALPGLLRLLWPSLKKFFALGRRFIRVRRLVWHTEIGLVDSATLAQLSGAIWAVKGWAASVMQQFFRLHAPPLLRVRPRYGRSFFRTVFSCILDFPLGYIIIAGLFAVYMAARVKIAGRGEVIVGASNPGSHENSHGEHQGNG